MKKILDIYDFIVIIGFVILAIGLWRMYPPACLIVCGILVMLFGVKISQQK